MSIVLFVGPTLAGERVGKLESDFVVRPPARQGDVYRVAETRPRAIGIVDGYFEDVPSVWHKEILWAISRGVSAYGSASIGALRAAELHAYGMIGVGEIFEAYRDGVFEADDEVALLHGPEETGFVGLTEPLVNVRATCRAAVAGAILDEGEAGAVIGAARSLFYKNRTWREIERVVRSAGLSPARLKNFVSWLPEGRVDQKRHDALAMIERMRSEQPETASEFEPTFLWERAVRGWKAEDERSAAFTDDLVTAVLNELRLEPDRYHQLKARALAHMQRLKDAGERDLVVSRSERAAARKRHRTKHGLLRASDLEKWLKAQRLGGRDYDRLIDETALTELAETEERPELRAAMIALLQLDGDFAAIEKRAAAKASTLADDKGGAPVEPPLPPILLRWFFRERLARDAPDDIDRFVGSLGLGSRDAFYGLVAAEYLYFQREGEKPAPWGI